MITGRNSSAVKVPGCEAYATVKDFHPEHCCVGFPDPFSLDACKKDCERKCRATNITDPCCFLDCGMKAHKIVDDSGKFDTSKCETVLKRSVNQDDKWVRCGLK